MLDKMFRVGQLFDVYGPLLTGRQQEFIRLYYYHDLSLGEIAEQYGITRQAVHDTLKRSEDSLEEYEEKLNLSSRMHSLQDALAELLQLLETMRENYEPESSATPEAIGGFFQAMGSKLRAIERELQKPSGVFEERVPGDEVRGEQA